MLEFYIEGVRGYPQDRPLSQRGGRATVWRMGLSARIRATALDVLLGQGLVDAQRRLHRAVGAGRLEMYHQLDDAHSYLLLQALPRLLDADPGLSLELHVVPAGDVGVDPEPGLRRGYALRDAIEIAERLDVTFPADASLPDASLLERATAILGVRRPAREQLTVALEVTSALWNGDRSALERLASSRGTARDAADVLAAAGRLQRRRGHYQGAMIRYGGGWFWGVDRLDVLVDALHLDGYDVPSPLLRPRESAPRVAAPEAETLELFFSFRSPYSYLALERAGAMASRHGIPLVIKPVLPMVMRGHAVPLVKRLYLARDAAQQARRLGIPFGKICDPLGGGVERCLALFGYAEERGAALAFCASAGRGIWAEALDVTKDDELAIVVRRAGLDWREARASLRDESWRERVEQNRVELLGRGLYGVPSFRLGDVTYWGQDRLDRLEEHLKAWAAAGATPT